MSAESMQEFVRELGDDIPLEAAADLLALTPAKYIGLASRLASEV